MLKRMISGILVLCFVCMIAAGCGESGSSASEETTEEATTQAVITTNLPKTDMTKWKYSSNDDVYYLTGVTYCEKPAIEKYGQLSVFVPGKYMEATKNSDGTYTCKLSESAELNGYTAQKAPIAMHINTEGYYASEPLTDETIEQYEMALEEISEYTSQGIIYIHPACRGVVEGAPLGVTDLKAAIRYMRYCDDVLPGDSESIFVFGMSGGGAQSAVLGASGDSELYDPYLEAIGAVQGVSDSVKGSMDWCPITSLDTADAEYEWMMGCTHSDRTDDEKAMSDKMSKAFADYVNSAGFKDKDGNVLTLEESKEGIYQAGSYYDYIKSEIERSLNNYIEDIDFDDPELKNGYGSPQGYIDDLNKDKKWASYDENTKKASITSIADYVKERKNAFPYYVGFDNPEGSNTLFGYGDGNGSHFDRILANVLTEMGSEYAADYNADLEKKDFVGNSVERRVEMIAPLYYLMESRDGYKKSTPAKYWRIRSGIEQPTTSLTTEVNLALALEQYDGIKDVDFEAVWEQGHVEAERKGEHTANFIEWINKCMKD